jgi:hypothetical protein
MATMEHYPLWINGEPWDSGTRLTVTDKTTGSPWATISQAGAKVEEMTELRLVVVNPQG